MLQCTDTASDIIYYLVYYLVESASSTIATSPAICYYLYIWHRLIIYDSLSMACNVSVTDGQNC